MGDLNFRVNENEKKVIERIAKHDLLSILKKDELNEFRD